VTYVVIFAVIALMLALVWLTIKASKPVKPHLVDAPALTRFELSICPDQFRMSYIDVESLTVEDRTQNIHVEESAAHAGPLTTQLNTLITSNYILKVPALSPELAFTEHALQRDSIHIRIRYAGQATWQAVFSPDLLPPNVGLLIDGVRKLALDFAQRTSVPAPEPSTALDTITARVRVDLSGTIYFNDSCVSLNELTHELNRLPPGADEVWLYREANWQNESTPEAEAVAHDTLERLLTHRLIIRVFGKNFDA